MNIEFLEIVRGDIKRCEEAQKTNKGTRALYQALIGKYNGIYEGFGKDIPSSGKACFGGDEFDYRPELNAIKEKLELIVATDREKDSLFDFKIMYEEDLKSLKEAISDCNNENTPEIAKTQLYKEVTAKYHSYIPQFSDGLYGYNESYSMYDELVGDELFHDLKQIYNNTKTERIT